MPDLHLANFVLIRESRYDDFALQSCLNSSFHQRSQQCRTPECNHAQKCFADEDNYMICQKCRGWTCLTCDTPVHSGVSCVEIAAKRAADAIRGTEEFASVEYLKNETKKCPGCSAHSVKISSCDHIICKWWTFIC